MNPRKRERKIRRAYRRLNRRHDCMPKCLAYLLEEAALNLIYGNDGLAIVLLDAAVGEAQRQMKRGELPTPVQPPLFHMKTLP